MPPAYHPRAGIIGTGTLMWMGTLPSVPMSSVPKLFHILALSCAVSVRPSVLCTIVSSTCFCEIAVAVCSTRSMPPAAWIGYAQGNAIPSVKASLSSQGRSGDSGGNTACSCVHSPAVLFSAFPNLKFVSLRPYQGKYTHRNEEFLAQMSSTTHISPDNQALDWNRVSS